MHTQPTRAWARPWSSYFRRRIRNDVTGLTPWEIVHYYVNLANAHVMTQHKRFSPVDRMNLRQINRAVMVQKGRGRVRKANLAGR